MLTTLTLQPPLGPASRLFCWLSPTEHQAVKSLYLTLAASEGVGVCTLFLSLAHNELPHLLLLRGWPAFKPRLLPPDHDFKSQPPGLVSIKSSQGLIQPHCFIGCPVGRQLMLWAIRV